MTSTAALVDALVDALIDDAAMFPPGDASAERAVGEHLDYRRSWFGSVVGPLVVPDTALAEVGRALERGSTSREPSEGAGQQPLPVSVVTSGGAGGLLALAKRHVVGVQVVAVESALRDLDDLVGNAERVATAAYELDPAISCYVELPYAPGWRHAVDVIEAAGLLGKIRTGGVEPEQYPSPSQLAEQLFVLVEADLGFKATAGLHHAWPNVARNERGLPLHSHGFLNLFMALDALIDGAEPVEAAQLLQIGDRNRIRAAVDLWNQAAALRIRRRLRSFGCCGVSDPVQDLVMLGLLEPPA